MPRRPDPELFNPLDGAASFRVFTPQEVRVARLRTPHRPEDASLKDDVKEVVDGLKATPPRKLAQWVGMGLLATTLLFVGFIGLMAATDDQVTPTGEKGFAKRAEDKEKERAKLKAVTQAALRPLAIPPPTPVTVNDFEIPDEPSKVVAKKGRKVKRTKR